MDEKKTFEEILATEYSERFDEIRKKMMVMSYYIYGPVAKNAGKGVDEIKSALKRIEKYQDTGNTEFLADAANFLMIEFMYPSHPKAHYRPTDHDESPGIHGISIREIEQLKLESLD